MDDVPKLGFWLVLLIPIGLGTIVDGLATASSLMAIMNLTNKVGIIMAVTTGIIITAFAAATKVIVFEIEGYLLKFLWLIASLVDWTTTFVWSGHFLLLNRDFGDSIVWDFTFDPTKLPQTIAALTVATIITFCPVCAPIIIDKITNNNE